MFDDLFREVRRLERGRRISAPVACDSEGYYDRECPSEECLFTFKVHEEDWRAKVRDEEVFCPFCGHTAGSGSWWTQQQLRHAEKVGLKELERQFGRAMKRSADRWNRRQPRNSFLSMKLRVENKPSRIRIPPAAASPMRLKIACPACGCRYAVIGAAFFCPACGHNAAEQMFSQSIAGIRSLLDLLPGLKAAIEDPDSAENTARQIIESALQNAVTAFQRYAEALYGTVPGAAPARRNAFQNLAEGSDLWRACTGKGYEHHLDAGERAALARAFQQRHLLAHTQGLVDQDYIDRSGDQTYRLGQRLVLRAETVREAAALIEKLAAGLAAALSRQP